MIRNRLAMLMLALGLISSIVFACDLEGWTFDSGNYIWLEGELIPLPASHFIHSIGARKVGEYGNIVEMHLKTLHPNSEVGSITIRSDADIKDFDNFSWGQLREIGGRGHVRNIEIRNYSFLLVEYPGVPNGTKAIFESEEYQIVVTGKIACQVLVAMLDEKKPDNYLAGQ